MVHQFHVGADNVANVTETTTLVAVAVHRNRSPGESLFNERRDNHPVLTGLSWRDRIEQTHDNGRQFFLAPACERQKLVDRFRTSGTPTALRRCPRHTVSVCAQRQGSAE